MPHHSKLLLLCTMLGAFAVNPLSYSVSGFSYMLILVSACLPLGCTDQDCILILMPDSCVASSAIFDPLWATNSTVAAVSKLDIVSPEWPCFRIGGQIPRPYSFEGNGTHNRNEWSSTQGQIAITKGPRKEFLMLVQILCQTLKYSQPTHINSDSRGITFQSRGIKAS